MLHKHSAAFIHLPWTICDNSDLLVKVISSKASYVENVLNFLAPEPYQLVRDTTYVLFHVSQGYEIGFMITCGFTESESKI